jgi:hypothetical protein
MKPEMIAVVSSQIASIGYDRDEAELYVTFNSGSTYVYMAVPSLVFAAMQKADSIGKFLNSQIKGTYEFRKLKE